MRKGALSYHLGRVNILYLKFPESTLIIKVNNVATKRKLWYLHLSSFAFFLFFGILDQVTTRRLSGLFFQGTRCTFYERGHNKFPARYASRSRRRVPRERIRSMRSSSIYIYMHNVNAAVNTSILNDGLEVTRFLVIISSRALWYYIWIVYRPLIKSN